MTRIVALLALVAGLIFAIGTWQTNKPARDLTEEVEPNDDPPVATPLRPGADIKGYIGRRQRKETSDRDVFVVEGLAPADVGRAISVRVSGVPGLDLVLEGYDRDGRSLFKVNDAGEGGGEHLSARTVPADPLYLVVRELWVQGAVPSENSTDPYTLRVDRVPP